MWLAHRRHALWRHLIHWFIPESMSQPKLELGNVSSDWLMMTPVVLEGVDPVFGKQVVFKCVRDIVIAYFIRSNQMCNASAAQRRTLCLMDVYRNLLSAGRCSLCSAYAVICLIIHMHTFSQITFSLCLNMLSLSRHHNLYIIYFCRRSPLSVLRLAYIIFILASL